MSSPSRRQHSTPTPHPHPSPANTPSGLCFPSFSACFVCLAVVIMLQPSACSESPGEGANFNICLNSSFQTYTNWNNASLGICLLVQFANCGFRSALFSTHQLFVDGAKAGIAAQGWMDGWGLWEGLSRRAGTSREGNQGLGKDLQASKIVIRLNILLLRTSIVFSFALGKAALISPLPEPWAGSHLVQTGLGSTHPIPWVQTSPRASSITGVLTFQ